MYTFLCVLHTNCSWGAFHTKHIPFCHQHTAIMQRQALVIPFVASYYPFGLVSFQPFVTHTKEMFQCSRHPASYIHFGPGGEALRPPPNPLQLLNLQISKPFMTNTM